MKGILIAQLLLPILLLAGLVVRPPRSWLALATQVLASLLALLALTHAGLWLFPPWWIPHATAVGITVAAIWLLRRRRPTRALPSTIPGWTRSSVFAIAGAVAILVTLRTVSGRQPPGRPAIDLSFPLGSGRYLVVNGGTAPLINAHLQSLDTSIARLRPWRGNAYAVDIVAIAASGTRARGVLPKDPSTYEIFGRPVVAPCDGEIVIAIDGLPDMPVPEFDRAHLAGNHVILACKHVHVVLAHFRRGSVRVRSGDQVRVGDTLAAVGNSGGTSEPHLHIHAQMPAPSAAPMAGDPVPMRLADRFLVRGDRVSIR